MDVGPQTGKRCWPLLTGLCRAIAPLMKPWCAEGDVPTAANLNLYRGRSSHAGWHSDDEPLFGKRGEAKLIVSVSFGTQALFKWKGTSCPSTDGHSCWLAHCDILVVDGQCQDEFYHCTDPGYEQERINVTFRWIRHHVASCSLSRQVWRVVCQRVRTKFVGEWLPLTFGKGPKGLRIREGCKPFTRSHVELHVFHITLLVISKIYVGRPRGAMSCRPESCLCW